MAEILTQEEINSLLECVDDKSYDIKIILKNFVGYIREQTVDSRRF